MNKTLGESRVRTSFNPSNVDLVNQVKQKTAELINLMNGLEYNPEDKATYGEFVRVKSLAMTEYESAGHWAIKAVTFGL